MSFSNATPVSDISGTPIAPGYSGMIVVYLLRLDLCFGTFVLEPDILRTKPSFPAGATHVGCTKVNIYPTRTPNTVVPLPRTSAAVADKATTSWSPGTATLDVELGSSPCQTNGGGEVMVGVGFGLRDRCDRDDACHAQEIIYTSGGATLGARQTRLGRQPKANHRDYLRPTAW